MLWVSSDLLEVNYWLIIILQLVVPIIMPNNLGCIRIIILLQASSSHVSENCSSTPAYLQVDEEGIRRVLDTLHTGGEGSITQWVHGEFIVIFEAICSHFTHQAHGEHF